MNSRIATAMNSPLLLAPAALDALLTCAQMGPLAQPSTRPAAQPAGTAAVISVMGPLSHRGSGPLSWLFGDSSYEGIRQDFRAALADDSVDQIIFEIDSPGGEVAGVFTLANEIYQARGKKPMCALINEAGLSGAYLIAAATGQIILAGDTAQAGSIGVVAMHRDQSGADQAAGMSYQYIFAGSHKIDGNPHQPLTDAAAQRLQATVDDVYTLFTKAVARYRGLSVQQVIDTQAATFAGKAAIAAGLADSIGTIDSILTNQGAFAMNLKEEIAKLFAGQPADKIAEALADHLPKPDTSAMDRAGQILDMCSLAGVSDLGAVRAMIDSAQPVEQIRTDILKAKADQPEIFSTVSALSTGAVNPILAEARKRAGVQA